MADRLITQIRQAALGYVQDEALEAGLTSDRDRTSIPFQQPSLAWYREQIEKFTTPTATDLLSVGELRSKNLGPFFGEMNMFVYDAKYKKTLPYYDRFPLVIPILDRSLGYNPRKEFMGINMHYLPILLRIKLLSELVEVYATGTSTDSFGRESFDERTKLVITNFASLLTKIKESTPCVKHYLIPNIKSNVRRIKATEFVIASLLPVADFHKNTTSISSQQVYRESQEKIRRV